jgi:apolipoprotein N-acyltransferase
MALAATVLFAAAFPTAGGEGAWPAIFIAPLPLVWLALRRPAPAAAIVAVFASSAAMWLWVERWLVDVTRVGHPLLAAYLALYPALFVWLLGRLASRPATARIPMTLAVPVVWVGLECLRGELVMHGYPWFLLGHPAINAPVIAQSADLLGTYFVSFLVASVAGAAADALLAAAGRVPLRRAAFWGAAVAAIHVGNLGYGLWRGGERRALSPGPAVLAIQTNLPQSNKLDWTLQDQARDLREFLSLTLEAASSPAGPLDLIIWPETMLPGMGLEPETLAVVAAAGLEYEPWLEGPEALVSLSGRTGVPVIVGSLVRVGPIPVEAEQGTRWEWRKTFNSAYLIVGDASPQRYDKVFLTPFGETMPYISSWPWLERSLLAIGARGMSFDLDVGERIVRLHVPWDRGRPWWPRDLVAATPICFEDTVGRYCRRMVYARGRKMADILINLSNDGWFGARDEGRRRHLQAARFRCIENRVPMVRCVNTGLTAAIDSRGSMIPGAGDSDTLPARSAGALRREPALDRRATLYGRIGDAWAWLCLAATVAGAALTWGRRASDGA